MMNIYPKKLIEFLNSTSNKYIPKKINKYDRLKLYRKYWTSFNDLFFKVMNIYDVDGIEYYSVKYKDMLNGEISYPISDDNIYELIIDRKHLDQINIINNKKAYSGADIKYWFFIHNIDLDSPKYRNFIQFIYPNSNSCICDHKYYRVFANRINNIYVDCKIKLVKQN